MPSHYALDNQTRPDQTNFYLYLFQRRQLMHIKTISEAKANLSYLIKMVQETDEPVIIGKAGKPIAVLSAYKQDHTPRKLGGNWEGKVKVSDDFNQIDERIADNFYNSTIFPDQQ